MELRSDSSDDYDGGWERAMADGHELGDLMLGPAHPHDRNDHYAPANRWGTRHGLKTHKFADPGELAQASQSIRGRPAPKTRNATVKPERTAAANVRRRAGSANQRATVSVKETKTARAARMAARLGLRVDELTDLRRRYAAAVNAARTLPRSQRDERIAAEVGVSRDLLDRFVEVHAEPQVSKAGTQPARSVSPKAGPPARGTAKSHKPKAAKTAQRKKAWVGRVPAPVRSTPRRTWTPLPTAPLPALNLDDLIARQADITLEELTRLRRERKRLAAVPGLTSAERTSSLAGAVGLTATQIERVMAIEAKYPSAPAPRPRRDDGEPRQESTLAVRPSAAVLSSGQAPKTLSMQVGTCRSCGVPVSFEGRCGCS